MERVLRTPASSVTSSAELAVWCLCAESEGRMAEAERWLFLEDQEMTDSPLRFGSRGR
jgi:hypothetical protein